jgi:uncharacterized alkaline shock family protein YloU
MSNIPPEFVQGAVGTIQIAPSVFEAIATSATLEVPGIVQLSTGLVQDFFGKKGVKVDIGENDLEIHLSLVVEYGTPIPPIVRRVQENVRDQIEAMTGLLVKACHVNVQGIHVADPEKRRQDTQPVKSRSLT